MFLASALFHTGYTGELVFSNSVTIWQKYSESYKKTLLNKTTE